MNSKEIIESGDLELYVYGALPENESAEIAALSKKDSTVLNEIVSIEKSVINLSSSIAPALSAGVFQSIKERLELGGGNVVQMNSRRSITPYLGWAASVALLIGVALQYNKVTDAQSEIGTLQNEKSTLQKSVVELELEKQQTVAALDVIRDSQNTVVSLAGQAAAPNATAKIYWNQKTQKVYVDGSGLPEPPKGKVYQIWSLKLVPALTPTSIGLLNDFTKNPGKIFAVEGTGDAQAFGITLEPAGGSKSPTMEQLYTLGKV